MPSEAPLAAADIETHGCKPSRSRRLRWRNSKAVRAKLRYFRRLAPAAVLGLAACVWQDARRPIRVARALALYRGLVAHCGGAPHARRPRRGPSRRAVRVVRSSGPRARLRAPPRLLPLRGGSPSPGRPRLWCRWPARAVSCSGVGPGAVPLRCSAPLRRRAAPSVFLAPAPSLRSAAFQPLSLSVRVLSWPGIEGHTLASFCGGSCCCG